MSADWWLGFATGLIFCNAVLRIVSIWFCVVPKKSQIENNDLLESYQRFKADIAIKNKHSKETAKTGVNRAFK